MGLFDRLFPKKYRYPVGMERWESLTAYSTAFRTWRGELYEFDQVRAAIDTLARNTSKLRVEIEGTAKGKMRTKLKIKPNPYQTWSQFWYLARTIYEMQNMQSSFPSLMIRTPLSVSFRFSRLSARLSHTRARNISVIPFTGTRERLSSLTDAVSSPSINTRMTSLVMQTTLSTEHSDSLI